MQSCKIQFLVSGGLPVRVHLHPSADDPSPERDAAAEGQEGLAGVGLQLAVRPLRQPVDPALVRIPSLGNFGASDLSFSSGQLLSGPHSFFMFFCSTSCATS